MSVVGFLGCLAVFLYLKNKARQPEKPTTTIALCTFSFWNLSADSTWGVGHFARNNDWISPKQKPFLKSNRERKMIQPYRWSVSQRDVGKLWFTEIQEALQPIVLFELWRIKACPDWLFLCGLDQATEGQLRWWWGGAMCHLGHSCPDIM